MKKLKISIILSLLVIVISCTAFSQFKPNSLYVELFGSGGLYSLNYDRMFTENFGARIGFMYFEADWLIFFIDAEMFLIPATLNYLVGTGKHKFELGAGPLFVFGSARFLGGESVSGSGVGWTGTIGYRYQQNQGGFMWRVGFTPAFFSGEIFPSGGISLGFSF